MPLHFGAKRVRVEFDDASLDFEVDAHPNYTCLLYNDRLPEHLRLNYDTYRNRDTGEPCFTPP